MGCGFICAIFHPTRNHPKTTPLTSQCHPTKTTKSSYPTRKSTSDDANGTLCRASTGNVMALAHLGNLKGNRRKPPVNAMKKSIETGRRLGSVYVDRLNCEGIKLLGNEKYRQGKYEEAIALYDQAIAIDPINARYYGNKSAALIGLQRFLEAVVACREAIRLDPSYCNAHCRLANLYFRLGVADKAIYHYKCSGYRAGNEDIARAQNLKNCLECCIEARDGGEWGKVIDKSRIALALGADSSPKILALKAEALMKLNRHEKAYIVIKDVPYIGTELYTEVLGSSSTSQVLQVRAIVYMANGRFEDAVCDVRQALRFDASEAVSINARRVIDVACARLNGNCLFKESRFPEALRTYNEGLEKDPENSILLCNRAACRLKLGQHEKAVDDCTKALSVRPSYTKARLRRANCNAKLEKWEAAIEDYEVVVRQIPADEEVIAGLSEAKRQLQRPNDFQNC